jgi:hypothetical protein
MKNASISKGFVLLLPCCGVGTPALHEAATPAFVNAPEQAASAAVTALRAPAVAPTESACDLKLFIEQLPSGGPNPIDPGKVGVLVVERRSESLLENGICIKRPGQKLELPATLLIAGTSDGPQLDRFCRDDARGYKLLVKDGVEQPIDACTWNGVFHAARPFTLTLLTDSGRSVGDYVEFLRVYRNGDLMAAWNRSNDALTPFRAIITGRSLRTGIVAASQPPHLSAMDLRVIPRDDSVAQAVDTAARDDLVRFKTAWKDAAGAGLNGVLPEGSEERKSLECLRESLRADARRIMHIVSGEVALAPSCDVLTGSRIPLRAAEPAPKPLSEEYAEIENQSRERLNELRAQAYDQVGALKEKVLAALPAQREHVGQVLRVALNASLQGASEHVKTAVGACVADLLEHEPGSSCDQALLRAGPLASLAYEKLVKLASLVDADIQALLGTADEAYALADRLTERSREVAASPARQAEIFKAVVESLHASAGGSFEPRRDNPALLSGEQKLDMLYADKLQFFFLAPWNGVPIRASNAEADVSAAVAVPLLDVAGVRYQWDRSRFADLRWAVGIGYAVTEVPDTGEKQTGALPNTSLGIGTFKVGLGIMTGGGLGSTSERLRIVIGADLFKLISGSNVEAF